MQLKVAHIGLAGSFDAMLVGWLVVMARGLYLARHLFTLCIRYCLIHKNVFVFNLNELDMLRGEYD